MTTKRVSACIFVVASSLAGCRGTGEVEYAGEVHVTSPELVEVSPGVQVIADADEPIFYSHGAYWLYRDGYWFRSNDYGRGYARVELTIVPTEVRVIERPQLYVHYSRNYNRTRAARTPNIRQRSPSQVQRPVQQQAQPTYPPPAANQVPSQQPAVPPTSPASPVYQPHTPETPGTEPNRDVTPQPNAVNPTKPSGVTPTQPMPPSSTPPGQNKSTNAPGQNKSTNPPGQNKSTNTVNPPGNSGSAPGQANRPQDRKLSSPPPANDNAPVNPSDRSDAATPPSTNNVDDRTKKNDETQDKTNKSDK